MRVINYTEFRNNLSENLNVVNENSEIVIVSRSKGKNVVLMSLEEYNSIQETLYLNSTSANRNRLEKALANAKSGKFEAHKLIEE